MSQQEPHAGQPGGNPNPYGQPISQPPPTGHYPPAAPPPGYYPPYAPPPPQPPGPLSPSDERMWGMLSYLLCLIAGFIAPLIIYFVYRDRSNFVRDTSKEALNLQITAAIVGVTATFGLFFFGVIFSIAVPPVGAIMFLVWFILIIGYQIAVITFEIIGAVRAYNGVVYRVPLILRLVK